MKTDILKGQWHQIRSGLKANWNKITEDDLDAVGGNEKELLKVLQKRYGYSPDTAAREFREFMKRQAEEKRAGNEPEGLEAGKGTGSIKDAVRRRA